MKDASSAHVLRYVLQPKRVQPKPITLDLFEAESYAAAVVVQQLVGNLVFYSNQGRYEPRLAESWQRSSPNLWTFKMRAGLRCDNGEEINPTSFKQSLERTIKHLSKKKPLPVFSQLKGFQEFLDGGKSLSGIVASGGELRFEFKKAVRSGLVEFLSFAPFGFICADNLKSDGSWKDPKRFISSGPYSVETFEVGAQYILRKRKDWSPFAKNSPDVVEIVHALPDNLRDIPTIIDSDVTLEKQGDKFVPFELVPEYLNAVLLGNIKAGYFSKIENRKVFRSAIEQAKGIFPKDWHGYVRSATFYSSQIQPTREAFVPNEEKPSLPLVIEGEEPTTGIVGTYTWPILRHALSALGWKFIFAGNQSTWSEVTSPKYDIRMRSPSIGGGFEAWGISSLFCSSLGSGLPDPSELICALLNDFELDRFSEEEIQSKVLDIIEDDSAILPIAHFGWKWYLSSGIRRSSLSPLISVIRFDQVELGSNE